MIRVGLPAPMLWRLRLRAHLTVNRLSRQTQNLRKGVLATINTDLAILRRKPHQLVRHPAAVLTPEELAAKLQAFETHYQQLVNLLCWAAKDGIHTDRDARYAELREWFMGNYDPMRPFLLRHLETVPEDLAAPGQGATRPRDAFETLFLPESVDAIIHAENIITRIMRTRSALDACWDQTSSTQHPA